MKKGSIMTIESRRKMRAKKLGKPSWNKGKKLSTIHRKNLSDSHKGNTNSQRQKETAKANWTGEKNPRWKGGITPQIRQIRGSLEMKLWRKAVFERDGYTCIWCGITGGLLHADHIKPFSLFPELRFAIDNGRTLCADCHRTTDTYAMRIPKK